MRPETTTARSKMASIGLGTSAGDVQVERSVRLDPWADEAGADAMNALTLDFDAAGRLVGIEVLDAKRVLPQSLIDGAEPI